MLSSAAAIGCGPKKATPYSGYCLVANQGAGSLAVIDLARFRHVRTVPLEAAPAQVVPHPAQPKAFVLAPSNGTVYEFDFASLSISRHTRAGTEATSMLLAPSLDALWVLTRNPAGLVEIPLDSFHARRHIRLAAAPDDFDLSADGHAAVSSHEAGAIILAELGRSSVERTIATAAEPTGVRFRRDGKQVLAASRADRSLTLFDVPTGKTVVRLPLPLEPRRFCFNPDGGQLFLSGDGMDAVTIVYPYQGEVAETVLAGRAPAAMAVTTASTTAAPNYLLVTNPQTDTVTVIDIETRKLVTVVEVGHEPREILITPDNQYALVLNEKSGDLAVIRLYSLNQPLRAHRYKSSSLFTLIPVGDKPVSAAVVAF